MGIYYSEYADRVGALDLCFQRYSRLDPFLELHGVKVRKQSARIFSLFVFFANIRNKRIHDPEIQHMAGRIMRHPTDGCHRLLAGSCRFSCPRGVSPIIFPEQLQKQAAVQYGQSGVNPINVYVAGLNKRHISQTTTYTTYSLRVYSSFLHLRNKGFEANSFWFLRKYCEQKYHDFLYVIL